MGRELKRVPLDFDWPLETVWCGYEFPYGNVKEEYGTKWHRYIMDQWQLIEPPTGDGYQLWETVSDGSPISPVFATREEFAAYLVGEGYSPEAVEKFIETGWAPSAIISFAGGQAKVITGIEACAMIPKEKQET